jgi:prepilin-type N-terminal cleavage/methylation domain-containing protein
MNNRRGFTLMELIAAGVLLGVLLLVCAQVWGVTAAQHRGIQNRQTALRAAANLMERLTTRSWDQLTTAGSADLQLSPATLDMLPDARLEVRIDEPAEGESGKRIAVSVRWPDRDGRPEQSVRLVAWKHRASSGEAKP